jgi:hypothetical protein
MVMRRGAVAGLVGVLENAHALVLEDHRVLVGISHRRISAHPRKIYRPSPARRTRAPVSPEATRRGTASSTRFVWDILDLVANAMLFVPIGLQLRPVLDGLPEYSASTLAGYALR